MFLLCDNCCGQNKNSCVLQYLMWRILTGQNTQITLSFLIVGHTKFAPDCCFGLVKRKYRRTYVSTLKDISEVVYNLAECNIAQLVSDVDGTFVVPTFDWTSFFASRMKKFTGIKKYHHLQFDISHPGIML